MDRWQLHNNEPVKGASINNGVDPDLCSLTYLCVSGQGGELHHLAEKGDSTGKNLSLLPGKLVPLQMERPSSSGKNFLQ